MEETQIVTDRQTLASIITECLKSASHTTPALDKPQTESEAANYLGVKSQTLAAWRTRSVGPTYYRVGSNIRYRQSDLEAYLLERKVAR